MTAIKRFTVTLDEEEYRMLSSLAHGHKPPLTLQYVVRFAIHELLEKADDPQSRPDLADPVSERTRR